MDKSIPYLLTLASDMPGADRFYDSIKCLGKVEHVAVQFLPFSKRTFSRSITNNIPFPGHFNKWKYVPNDLDPERYIIFSDTSDVIFQWALPKFEYDLYLAPEAVEHWDTMWKEHIEKFPAFATLMYKEVMNCGTFAMKVKTMYEYRDFIMNFDSQGYGKWDYRLEQLYFNMFVYMRHDLSKVIDRSIFCPLFANTYHGIKKADDGLWETENEVISCVHANGDVELKKQL